MKDIRRLVFQLILLLIALFVLYLLVVFVPAFHTQSSLRSFKAAPPPNIRPSAESAAIARTPQSFQYLVSFTDRGFEPTTLAIKRNETVRFTNNSTGKLWIAAGGSSDTLYPNVQNGCGSSALDSCTALAPGEYWQFTFGEKGTWSFQNNLDKSQRGVIIVRVK